MSHCHPSLPKLYTFFFLLQHLFLYSHSRLHSTFAYDIQVYLYYSLLYFLIYLFLYCHSLLRLNFIYASSVYLNSSLCFSSFYAYSLLSSTLTLNYHRCHQSLSKLFTSFLLLHLFLYSHPLLHWTFTYASNVYLNSSISIPSFYTYFVFSSTFTVSFHMSHCLSVRVMQWVMVVRHFWITNRIHSSKYQLIHHSLTVIILIWYK